MFPKKYAIITEIIDGCIPFQNLNHLQEVEYFDSYFSLFFASLSKPVFGTFYLIRNGVFGNRKRGVIVKLAFTV